MIYTLRLTGEQVNLIGAALGKLPFETVSALVQALQLQIQQQEAAAKAEPEKVAEAA